MLEVYVPRKRRKKIAEIARGLRDEYHIPPLNEEKLERIANDHDLSVHLLPGAVTAYLLGRHIVLPDDTNKFSHAAHELGHFFPNTRSEAEANYFACQLTKIGIIRGYIQDVVRGLPFMISQFRNPEHLNDFRERLYRLEELGITRSGTQ